MSLSASERYDEFQEEIQCSCPSPCYADHRRLDAREAASRILDLYDSGAILPKDTAAVTEAMENLRRACAGRVSLELIGALCGAGILVLAVALDYF